MIGDATLARLYIVARGERGVPLPEVNAEELARALGAAARWWDEHLADEAETQLGAEAAKRLTRIAGRMIPEGYKADVPLAAAGADLMRVVRLAQSGDAVTVHLYAAPRPAPAQHHLKLAPLRTPTPPSPPLPP